MQITTGSELDMVGSRLWDFEGWYRSIGIVIAAEIFDASRPYVFCSLIIVIQNKMLGALVAMDDMFRTQMAATYGIR